MERTPEPELMDDDAQARAYAEADFEAPHAACVQELLERHGQALEALSENAVALDLGCGPADITLRVARALPRLRLVGVDGSPAMLRYGQRALDATQLGARVQLVEGYLPGAKLPIEKYDVVLSNSLLHHLRDPSVLWHAVHAHGKEGALVYVMDLMRPASDALAKQMVQRYCEGEPEVLRRDFYHSLRAAYTVPEVRAQLKEVGLDALVVEATSDRHLVVSGRLPAR